MKTVIPSYDRPTSIQTINTLKKHNIDLSQIYLFLANDDERERYSSHVPNEVNIVVGVKGLSEQRNFEENEILISMDDDIKEFIILEKSLQEVLDECIEYLKNSKYQLIGFPPTSNKFYNKSNSYYTDL